MQHAGLWMMPAYIISSVREGKLDSRSTCNPRVMRRRYMRPGFGLYMYSTRFAQALLSLHVGSGQSSTTLDVRPAATDENAYRMVELATSPSGRWDWMSRRNPSPPMPILGRSCLPIQHGGKATPRSADHAVAVFSRQRARSSSVALEICGANCTWQTWICKLCENLLVCGLAGCSWPADSPS
jgi:hypothetical protein